MARYYFSTPGVYYFDPWGVQPVTFVAGASTMPSTGMPRPVGPPPAPSPPVRPRTFWSPFMAPRPPVTPVEPPTFDPMWYRKVFRPPMSPVGVMRVPEELPWYRTKLRKMYRGIFGPGPIPAYQRPIPGDWLGELLRSPH